MIIDEHNISIVLTSIPVDLAYLAFLKAISETYLFLLELDFYGCLDSELL